MKVTTTYSVLVYVANVPDSERVWTGTDRAQALRVVQEMMQKYPESCVRFSETTYYDPRE